MNCNVGGMDRTIRIVAGIALILIGLVAPVGALWQGIALLIAAVALVTAIVRYCPANAILGFNSCDEGKNKS